MERNHQQLLIQNRVKLVCELPLEGVLLRMGSNFTDSNRDEILSEKTNHDKTRSFLNLLPTRGPHAYHSFCTALTSVGCRHLIPREEKLIKCYKWRWVCNDDGSVLIEDHRRWMTEEAAKKEAHNCTPTFSSWDGVGSPGVKLIITQDTATQ